MANQRLSGFLKKYRVLPLFGISLCFLGVLLMLAGCASLGITSLPLTPLAPVAAQPAVTPQAAPQAVSAQPQGSGTLPVVGPPPQAPMAISPVQGTGITGQITATPALPAQSLPAAPLPIRVPARHPVFDALIRGGGLGSVYRWGEGAQLLSQGNVVKSVGPMETPGKLKDAFYLGLGADDRTAISWIAVYFSKDESFSDFFVCDITRRFLDDGSEILFSRSDFKVGAGNPDWSQVKVVQIACQSKDGTSIRVLPYYLATFTGVGG